MTSYSYDTRSPLIKNRRPYRLRVSTYARGVGSQWGGEDKVANYLPSLRVALGSFADMQPSGPCRTAANKALDKLYEDMSQKGDLLVAWKQRQQAIDQAAGLVGGAVRAIRAIKRRDPRILRAILRKRPEAKDIAAQPSSVWLGYWFGIVPTIGDLHHALGIFSTPLPASFFSHTGGSTTSVDWGRNAAGREGFRGQCATRCKIGGRVISVDPNVQLATMLGFGQPLSVGLELVPFSWLLNYFVNVQQLVTNLEPRFPGFTFDQQYTTFSMKFTGTYSYYETIGPSKGQLVVVSANRMNYVRRHTTWPLYGLEFSSPASLSGQRLSYIAAVAVQLLSGFK